MLLIYSNEFVYSKINKYTCIFRIKPALPIYCDDVKDSPKQVLHRSALQKHVQNSIKHTKQVLVSLNEGFIVICPLAGTRVNGSPVAFAPETFLLAHLCWD